MDWLKTNDFTIVLGISFVAVYALSKILKPQSLVHPLLLGRQADVSRVRMPGESAVYRNYATGLMGRLPERPKPEVKLLFDLLPDDHIAERLLWNTRTTNAEIKARSTALGTALVQVAGLVPGESTALLLLDNCIEFLITDLALAKHSIVSFTLESLSLVIPALEKHNPTTVIVHEHFLEHILEHVSDLRQGTHHSIIVVGDEKGNSVGHSQRLGIRVLRWEDLEAKGMSLSKPEVPAPSPDDTFSVALFSQGGELRGAQIKHYTMTAGVTSARLFFPLADPISPLDTILSVFPIRTPFGRTVLYTALYQGANFVSPSVPLFTGTEFKPSIDILEFAQTSTSTPTLLFLTPDFVRPLASLIVTAARSNLFFWLGWRHKLRGLQEGFLTKTSFWDNLVWEPARTKVLDKVELTLRGIVVSQGELETSELENARIAFSVPIVMTYSHPIACGPVFASHPSDLQSFPANMAPGAFKAHFGPPAPNVEAKLLHVEDARVEAGRDPEGEIALRGPSIAKLLLEKDEADNEGWVSTGQTARVHTNGTFRLY